MDVSDTRHLKALENVSGKLKRLLADAMLDETTVQDLLKNDCEARCQA